MKKVLSIVVACAFVFGAFTAQAEETCGWDAIGVVGNWSAAPYDIHGNGVIEGVTFGAQQGWWNDDLMGCYEAFKAPAFLYYLPGCDPDGNGVVEMQWLLDMYNFLLTQPMSASAFYSAPCETSCDDVAGLDFMGGTGVPTPMGAAMTNGTCSTIFGNSTFELPGNVKLFASTGDCDAACGGCQADDDCNADERCLFEEGTCGEAGNGVCVVPSGDSCISIWDPVCVCGHQIVSNSCAAASNAQTVMFAGECAPEDVCNFNGGTWNGTDCDCPAGTLWNYQRGCELI